MKPSNAFDWPTAWTAEAALQQRKKPPRLFRLDPIPFPPDYPARNGGR
jgi:hypothetical protein